jgi:circadian clock protein KaiC
VIKYRGSGFGRNEYPYVITGEGISLLPISTAGLGHEPLGPKVSSGHPRLDTIMDGGYRRASCALIAGPSGTGKTTLASPSRGLPVSAARECSTSASKNRKGRW